MSYLKEAQLRWRETTPPFFVKTQKICAGLVVLGGSFIGTGAALHWTWLTYAGTAISGGFTVAGAVCNFVVTSLGLIIPPGGSITNKTDDPIEVKPTS